MRKSFLILLLALGMQQCKSTQEKDRIYYFYNGDKAEKKFHRYDLQNDTLYYILYSINKPIHPLDSFSLGRGYKVFGLRHFCKSPDYKDTFWVKHKSYLDSVDYFNNEWFKKEDNLDQFWKSAYGKVDSLKIYMIEPIKGTDSLMVRRVHRYYDLR